MVSAPLRQAARNAGGARPNLLSQREREGPSEAGKVTAYAARRLVETPEFPNLSPIYPVSKSASLPDGWGKCARRAGRWLQRRTTPAAPIMILAAPSDFVRPSLPTISMAARLSREIIGLRLALSLFGRALDRTG